MGILASLLAITSILSVFATGQYDLAIVLPETEPDATSVAIIGICIAICFGILICFISIAFGDYLGPVIGLRNAPSSWIYLIGLIVFLTGIEQVLYKLCIRGKQFRTLATSQFSQQLGANGLKISWALWVCLQMDCYLERFLDKSFLPQYCSGQSTTVLLRKRIVHTKQT